MAAYHNKYMDVPREKLEEYINTAIRPRADSISSSGILSSVRIYIERFINGFKSLHFMDMINNPKRFYNSLCRMLQIKPDTLTRILVTVFAIRLVYKNSNYLIVISDVYSVFHHIHLVGLFMDMLIVQLSTTIYLSILEAYICNIHPEILGTARQINFDRVKRYRDIWKHIKKMDIIGAMELMARSFIQTEKDVFRWQWTVGKYDPFHLYKTMFVIDWLTALAMPVLGIVMLMNLDEIGEGFNQVERDMPEEIRRIDRKMREKGFRV